jgi:hypothetical protein
MRLAQRRAERHHARVRHNLLRLDERLREDMAYSGPIE